MTTATTMIITSVTLLTGYSSLGLLVLVAGYGTSGFLCLASHLPVGLLRLLQCLAHRVFDPEILDRLCLRRVNRGRPLVTFPDHSPLLLPRLNAHG
jgi:hypothetical protein